MTELIKAITEIENHAIVDKNGWPKNYDGFKITTSEQDIYVLITNHTNCCENWGYLSTLDNSNEFIGAELLDVELIDSDLKVTHADDGWDDDEDDQNAIFVNFVTGRGNFQLVVYNSHNGYYGHEVRIISKQLTSREVI